MTGRRCQHKFGRLKAEERQNRGRWKPSTAEGNLDVFKI